MPVLNYLSLASQPVGSVLTEDMIYTNCLTADGGDFAVVFSPTAVGQFTVSTNGPPFPSPIRIGNDLYDGTESPAIQLSNVLNFGTIEFALPLTNLAVLSVSGFTQIPDLGHLPATYDLVVLGSSLRDPPYSTVNWTLQLNCGQNNFIQFEDAEHGAAVKYAATPYPVNTWLYFTMSMDTVARIECAAVYNVADGSLVASYTNTVGITNTYMDYWLFGNNEAGSQSDAPIYFSGLTWSNSPVPVFVPDYTPPTNMLIGQWKFNGDLTDSSANGNIGAEFGGAYGYVTGVDGVPQHAIGITNGTISTASTNPVNAITVSFWMNPSSPGMPMARDEFQSWYTYVDAAGAAQFDVHTASGILNVSTADNWFGAWHLFTATWDGAGDGLVRIYRDGVLDVAGNLPLFGTIVPPSTRMTIGSGHSGYPITAQFDDVRLYGRALNEFEVAALYALGADGDINLAAAPDPQFVLSADQFVQFSKSADLAAWESIGPVTNRLVVSGADAAAYFRAQAMADLHWTPAVPLGDTTYQILQCSTSADGSLCATNLYAITNQTSVFLPLQGAGTNWFSVSPVVDGAPAAPSNILSWPPPSLTITMLPWTASN